jgi:anti-anti-sigma regulatory factor
VDYVRERVLERLSARTDAIRLLVFFLGAVPKVDLAGAEFLAELAKTCRARGIDFRLADAHGDVRDALRRIHFEHEHGPVQPGQTVELVISQWEAARPR